MLFSSATANNRIKSPFRSFWMAGYECADMLNVHRTRIDMLTATGHLAQLAEDYDLLQPFGIRTVREGIRWSVVETSPFQYDWSTVRYMIRMGLSKGIQQVWDLCHFGFPGALSPLDDDFEVRFIDLCKSFVTCYRQTDPAATIIVTPVNEIGFLSWLGGDQAGTVPYRTNAGWEVKYELVKACISGIRAMKEMDSNLLVLTTEPLMNIVPAADADAETQRHAAEQNKYQFQVTDMLEGRLCKELGGSPALVDIHGLNYYYNNQWIAGSFEFLPWANEHGDPRWKPLSTLIRDFQKRYEKPVILSETSHPKEHRPNWLQFIAHECALLQDIPFWGICWYPAIDRPDWDDLSVCHHSGFWDVYDGERILCQPLAQKFIQLYTRGGVDSIQHNP